MGFISLCYSGAVKSESNGKAILMASATTSQTGPASRDLLAALNKVYGGRSFRRDALGRRIALPSEIAHLLAQNADAASAALPSMETGQRTPLLAAPNPAER
jgi:hypothetical protein